MYVYRSNCNTTTFEKAQQANKRPYRSNKYQSDVIKRNDERYHCVMKSTDCTK